MPPSPPPLPATPRAHGRGSIRAFWQRISEGIQIDELWTQFTADARASYGFYGKDIDWDEINKQRRWRRPFHVAKQFFWALLLKMTPARRVLLLVSLVLLLLSGIKFQIGQDVTFDFRFEIFAAFLLLLLLSLELADKVTMKRDLEIAREIQLWLVPSEPPIVSGADLAFATRPQNSVAGDYYDAFYPDPASSDRLLLVIADVAGKSVPAALLMATLQASLRTIAGENASLPDLVARLNRYACAHSLDGRRFTTAVLAEYSLSQRRLSYVNAGHNAPIVCRRNGGLDKLEVGGLPLGIEASAAYETAAIELQPGDSLVLYTDGVIDAFNESGEEFGAGRLQAAIQAMPTSSANDTLNFLMRRVDEFVKETRQFDDITCFVFLCK